MSYRSNASQLTQTGAVRQETPAPVADFGAGGATLVGTVEHARIIGSPESRTVRGWVAKGGEQQIMKLPVFSGHWWLVCLQNFLQQLLLLDTIHQAHG